MSGVPADLCAPRVTVVIPTYNYAGVLEYSIASVLDQTFRDFELLVIGDGCTDNSERVVTGIGDPRVQWVNLAKNTGHQVGPNNEGLRRARGTVVAYLGHDDLWLPHHLELLMGAFDAGAPAAHTSVFRADPGRPCYTTPEPGWSYTRGEWIPPTSVAMQRSRAVEVGGWRDARNTGNLGPESDLLARIFDVAGPPVWIPRLTCVKLAAALRRNVYRTRPTHEQAYWLARIRESNDPERAIGAQVGAPYDLAGDRVGLRLPTRAWRWAWRRVRKRLELPAELAKTRIRHNQRFKGSR